jgi:hypothetical protein
MKTFFNRAVIVAATLLASTSANAALVSFNIAVVGSGYGAGAAYDPAVVDLTFLFDNSADIAGTTTGVTLNGMSFSSAYGPVKFAYSAAFDTMLVGNKVGGSVCGISVPESNFCLRIEQVSTAPTATELNYSVKDDALYHSDSITQRVTLIPVPEVPEPASWATMIAGLGVAGALLRRRAVKVAFAG